MDRQIVYPGAIPLETDLLHTNKYAMIGLAKLASALLGSNTYVHGLACAPTSPASMLVNVDPGQIYSLQNIDGTAYSSLAADTTHAILKQGLILDSTQFTITAPGTPGYSVNYLVQVTYTDTDSGATTLPYYNATDPSVAWSGPNNSGTAQNTVRSGVCTIALKSGVAATTGTQTTPSPDTGYTGLYVITVAQGATTITAANIFVYPNAPIINQAGIYDSFQRNTAIYGSDSGSANAYVVNINPKIQSLTDGVEVIFKATNANTGSATLNICALGAFPIISKAGATLIANEVVPNSLVKVRWSVIATSWMLIDATGTFQTAPTASAGTANTQVATTAFVGSAISNATGRLISTQVFTASGTYTPTAGTKKVVVTVVGGGGGGGGTFSTNASQNAAGSGGGGGAEAVGVFTTGFSGVAMVIGSAGVSAAGANGTDGGVTSFGTLLTAAGGGGGPRGLAATSGNTSGSAGGSAVTGTALIVKAGQDGGAGTVYSVGTTLSGKGGDSNYGYGGSPGGTGSSAGSGSTGNPGKDYGSGGAGASGSISDVARSGGSGRPGVIIVEEYA